MLSAAIKHVWIHHAGVTCPPLHTIPHGSTSNSDHECGNVVRFHCDPGHALVGPLSMNCNETGLWTEQQPSCEGIWVNDTYVYHTLLYCLCTFSFAVFRCSWAKGQQSLLYHLWCHAHSIFPILSLLVLLLWCGVQNGIRAQWSCGMWIRRNLERNISTMPRLGKHTSPITTFIFHSFYHSFHSHLYYILCCLSWCTPISFQCPALILIHTSSNFIYSPSFLPTPPLSPHSHNLWSPYPPSEWIHVCAGQSVWCECLSAWRSPHVCLRGDLWLWGGIHTQWGPEDQLHCWGSMEWRSAHLQLYAVKLYSCVYTYVYSIPCFKTLWM